MYTITQAAKRSGIGDAAEALAETFRAEVDRPSRTG